MLTIFGALTNITNKAFDLKIEDLFDPQNVGGSFLGGFYLVFLAIASALGVGMLIYGGIMYFLAFGSEERATTAKNIINWALIGLIVTVFSAMIIFFFIYALTKGGGAPDIYPKLPGS
jgi:uncharacterized BrkB/YihY/UPF0761 family membrane protein